MEGKTNGSFWPSYVDIMTTLFAVMLVLFAVSFSRFKIKERELEASQKMLEEIVDEYEDIITVYSTVGEIDSTSYFGYNAQYLKHLFTVEVKYQPKEYMISRLELDRTNVELANSKRDSILDAGRLVQSTIRSLENKNVKHDNIKFLVIIEGQSSKVPFDIDDWRNNYTLSYLRAQYLNKFWKENGIDIDAIPKCELIISGSGEEGVPRYAEDKSLGAANPDLKNQRFLIHIVPVIGNIDMTKQKIQRTKQMMGK